MGLVKKTINGSTVNTAIKSVKMSSVCQQLITSLFSGDLEEATEILIKLSAISSNSTFVVLLVVGILVCASKSGCQSVSVQALQNEVVNILKNMGSGDGPAAKSSIKQNFTKVIQELYEDNDADYREINQLIKKIKSGISRMPTWTSKSAVAVEECIIPIIENTLSEQVANEFKLSFSNRKGRKIVNVPTDTLIDIKAVHNSLRSELKTHGVKLHVTRIIKEREASSYRKLDATKNAPIPMYYSIRACLQEKNVWDVKVNIYFHTEDVQRCIRETNNKQEKTGELLIKYAKLQLPGLLSAIEKQKKIEENKERIDKQNTKAFNLICYKNFKKHFTKLKNLEEYSETAIKKLMSIYTKNEEKFNKALKSVNAEERIQLGRDILAYKQKAPKTLNEKFLKSTLSRLSKIIINANKPTNTNL